LAGHSKWKNIQHRKGRQDAKKGKVFHKLAREIYVAARSGDLDPANNQKLKLAIAKAKAENMPNENIERAIKKAAGGAADENYDEILYEGYGPDGVAVLVEVLTDNRNRTAAEVRHIFSKHEGNLSEAGSVAWMFERKGVLMLDAEQVDDEEELLLLALEAGAEDIQSEAQVEIITAPQEIEQVKSALEAEQLQIESAEVTFVPTNKVPISGEQLPMLISLLERLEEQDDVQGVHANFDVDEQEWQQYLQDS
jgi:YebC/PmpR family DNA-binding regulatory protein